MQQANFGPAAVDVGQITYPPSILIITNTVDFSADLHQMLEANNCCVHCIKACGDYLSEIRREYFDLIVLDIALISPDTVDLFNTVSADPEWVAAPKVILTPPGFNIDANPILKALSSSYHFYHDAFVESRLLQVIEQIHYLAYRYL
jgi:DNA-binding NtrC family response regulator